MLVLLGLGRRLDKHGLLRKEGSPNFSPHREDPLPHLATWERSLPCEPEEEILRNQARTLIDDCVVWKPIRRKEWHATPRRRLIGGRGIHGGPPPEDGAHHRPDHRGRDHDRAVMPDASLPPGPWTNRRCRGSRSSVVWVGDALIKSMSLVHLLEYAVTPIRINRRIGGLDLRHGRQPFARFSIFVTNALKALSAEFISLRSWLASFVFFFGKASYRLCIS